MATTTLVEAALQVLNEPDPCEKARLGEAAASRWLCGDISVPYRRSSDDGDPEPPPPDRPARLSSVKLVPSHRMPKLGRAGTLHSKQAIVHSLVHTESWAIDLSWDIIARFGKQESMPLDFFTDFVRVAHDEGRHFTLLCARLQELGSFYGAFPAHDGLWDSAIKTSNDLLARLAIEHCVHEARGLDVLPTFISRFREGGDHCTADLLEKVVYPEEISHCAAGVKWFRYLCIRNPGCSRNPCPSVSSSVGSHNCDSEESASEENTSGTDCDESVSHSKRALESSAVVGNPENEIVTQTFHATVRRYFRGVLKPPFNKQARDDAGFGPEWYEPLAMKVPCGNLSVANVVV